MLTRRGITDARKVAQKLKNKKFEVAFQTRLSRSKDTLKEVLKYHPECKIIITNDKMIERSYGRLAGKKHNTIIEKYGKKQFEIWHRSHDTSPPGGESIKMVEKRVTSFINELITFMKRNKVNVAISAHGNSMRPFRKYFEKLSLKQMMELENPWDDYFHYTVNI